MVCIYCSSSTQVTNSRHQKRLNQVWRRRTCGQCGGVFTTHEIADLSTGLSVSYTATDLRPFIRELLFVSVYESCKHRQNSVYDATHLTQTVISKLTAKTSKSGVGVVARNELVELCASTLATFDMAAATMYRAYHKSA